MVPFQARAGFLILFKHLKFINYFLLDHLNLLFSGKKSNKVDGFTVEQWRRQLGNGAKKTITFQKWAIHAQTHFTNPFTSEAFRALIVPHADEYYPKDFTANTPVIMASTFTNRKAGEIMGGSKLNGGSR